MWFLDRIVEWLNTVTNLFRDAYLEVSGWISPFRYLSTPLFYLLVAFSNITFYFSQFNDWIDDVAKKISTFLTELDLTQWFKPWIEKILDAWNWFLTRWGWFWQSAGEWWGTVIPTVKGWIAIATEGLDALKVAWGNFWTISWPQWMGQFETLRASWNNFWTITFPTLVSFNWLTTWWSSRVADIQNLIDSAFTTRTSFWAGWQDLRDNVVEFFSDPLEWLWARLTDWFLGPEE